MAQANLLGHANAFWSVLSQEFIKLSGGCIPVESQVKNMCEKAARSAKLDKHRIEDIVSEELCKPRKRFEAFFDKLSYKEIRKRQDLVDSQLTTIWQEIEKRGNSHIRHNALIRLQLWQKENDEAMLRLFDREESRREKYGRRKK